MIAQLAYDALAWLLKWPMYVAIGAGMIAGALLSWVI